jgi:putative ABC transport system permease protein
MLKDLRFGFRMLKRDPGFAIVAILCLTLGIGANAAVYSWMEGILFRPFPAVAQPDRLLVVAGTARGTSGFRDVSWPDLIPMWRP